MRAWGWPTLPPELRYAVFDFVKQDHVTHESKPYLRAGYARVCREWQMEFEDDNFQVLVLDQHRLNDFERLVCDSRRRDLVQRINLRVLLKSYDCMVCQLPEGASTRSQNDEIFISTMRRFLTLVSTWPLKKGRGLTLDLSIYSPSDAMHSFRDFPLAEEYPYTAGLALPEKHITPPLGDASAPACFAAFMDEPTFGAKKRTSATVCSREARNLDDLSAFAQVIEWMAQGLPRVDAITSLTLRRPYRRGISTQGLTKLLDEAFPNLETLRHERWKIPARTARAARAMAEWETQCLLRLSLRPSMRAFHLFADDDGEQPFAEAGRLTTAALVRASPNLQSLSASFLVDAVDFFNVLQVEAELWPDNGGWRQGGCPEMRKLSLTSPLLRPDGGGQEMGGLLTSAVAAVVRDMPRLETMEIWNGGQGFGCVFRYGVVGGRRRFVWKSTFRIEFVERIFEELREVYPGVDFRVEGVSPEGMDSYYDILRRLELADEMLDPLSRFQMEWERQKRLRK
ncbi:hypothetical protein ACHAQA_002571 [Verticillium albo-atrum]